jgi:serine phosphatase RsbU (regulator of sigma subunit)/integral membrane sensor domain MASE1
LAEGLVQPVGGDRRRAEAGVRPTWLVVAVVVVAYAFGALLAFAAFGATTIVVLFLPAGVTLSALVLTPTRQWPWVLAAVAVTEIVVDVSHGQSLRYVWGFALANTAEPLVGAWLLRRRLPARPDLLRRRDLVAFLICCVTAGPLVGAVVGATTISASSHRGWWESALPFWAGDATGVLTVAGCVLAWRHRPRPGLAPAGRWGLAVIATVAITMAGFWPAHLPLFYLPIPLLFWLAFGQRLLVALTCGLAMTVTANVLTSAGHGPWAALEGPITERTTTLQLFLGVAILGAWFLAVGVAERDTARRATSTERAARQRLHVVQTLTARLATAATSRAIAETVVRDGAALFADHAALGIASPDVQQLSTWTSTGRPPDIAEPGPDTELGAPTPLADAARSGRPVIHQRVDELATNYPESAQEYRSMGMSSGVYLPVGDRGGQPRGAVGFAFAREHAVDADVVAMAQTLASIIGQALQRAQHHERELAAAHQLQHALLPVLDRDHPGIRVAADYRPAERTHDVGGDWYDVFALPDERIGLAVGDVVGHDLTAAAAMARIQSALRILAQAANGPAQVLEELDRASAVITDSFMTTVGYADYDPRTGLLRYACAGHPPPLLLSASGAQYLWGGRSAPVGVTGAPRPQAQCVVTTGSTLIWYTDGLVERTSVPLPVSLDRLADVAAPLAGHDPDALCDAVLHGMAGHDALADDAVVLCIRFGEEPHPGVAAALQVTLAENEPAGRTPAPDSIIRPREPDTRAGRGRPNAHAAPPRPCSVVA